MPRASNACTPLRCPPSPAHPPLLSQGVRCWPKRLCRRTAATASASGMCTESNGLGKVGAGASARVDGGEQWAGAGRAMHHHSNSPEAQGSRRHMAGGRKRQGSWRRGSEEARARQRRAGTAMADSRMWWAGGWMDVCVGGEGGGRAAALQYIHMYSTCCMFAPLRPAAPPPLPPAQAAAPRLNRSRQDTGEGGACGIDAGAHTYGSAAVPHKPWQPKLLCGVQQNGRRLPSVLRPASSFAFFPRPAPARPLLTRAVGCNACLGHALELGRHTRTHGLKQCRARLGAWQAWVRCVGRRARLLPAPRSPGGTSAATTTFCL